MFATTTSTGVRRCRRFVASTKNHQRYFSPLVEKIATISTYKNQQQQQQQALQKSKNHHNRRGQLFLSSQIQQQQQHSQRLHSMHIQKRFFLARTSESHEQDSPELKAKNFVIQIGYEPKIAQGVIDALKQSGITGTALLSTVRSMAGRWEVGEDAGLESLVEAVTIQLARQEGRKPIKLYCVPPDAWKSSEEDQEDFSDVVITDDEERRLMLSRAFVVEAMTGLSLTDVAKFGDGHGASQLGDMIECACSGIMACSTCHVIIEPNWYDKVGEPCEAEQDMLDLAYAPRSTSRLGCQINLEENMDGMIILLPKGANNLMDDIPFQD